MRVPSAPLRRGTSPKYDMKSLHVSQSSPVGFVGGWMVSESAVEVGLVHAGRLRQSVLRSAFEGMNWINYSMDIFLQNVQ